MMHHDFFYQNYEFQDYPAEQPLPERSECAMVWGQAVPTRSLNQKPCHLGEFRFSNPKVRPDPVFGPT